MSSFDLLNYLMLKGQQDISVSTDSPQCIGTQLAAATAGAPATGTWPTANLALYVPMRILAPCTVYRTFVLNGTAVSGNLDQGIYDSAGTRLVSKGTTAHANIQTLQYLDITDTVLQPGLYYLGTSFDNTTAQVMQWAVGLTGWGKAWGLAQEASAFALPATATMAAWGQGYVPMVGMIMRSTP